MNSNQTYLEHGIDRENHQGNDLVHIGFVISCMAIAATVAILFFQTFDEKPLVSRDRLVGKTMPVEVEGATTLK